MGGDEELRSWAAAASDARAAVAEYDKARQWLTRATADSQPKAPFAAEVWVFDRDLTHVVLVHHRWRGWVPPGGRVEPGETPREAATRELCEETGLRVELQSLPAAVAVRSYSRLWEPTLGLSYAAIADLSTQFLAESGQPVAWKRLDGGWDSYFPGDQDRMRRHATTLARTPTAE